MTRWCAPAPSGASRSCRSSRSRGRPGRAGGDRRSPGRCSRWPAGTARPPAQIRLAWTLHQSPNVLAIPGTGNVAHLEENVAAAALRLSPDDLSLLDAAD